MFTLHPQTKKQWQRFRTQKRGYWSALLLVVLIALSCVAELIANNRALIVHYQGHYFSRPTALFYLAQALAWITHTKPTTAIYNNNFAKQQTRTTGC